MHLVPLVFYAAAAAAYLTHFAWRDPRVGRLSTALLGGAVLAHTFLIGMQTVQVGHAPLVGTTAAISAFVWLLGLSYLYVELTTDERAMGVFVAPLLVALALIRRSIQREPQAAAASEPALHGAHRLDAVRLRELRAGLRAGRDLRAAVQGDQAKHLGFFYARLPSLQALDAMNGRVVTIGWIFLTLGIAIGALWATQIHASPDPRAQAMGIRDPKILAAVLCWFIYTFALVGADDDRLERPPRGVAVGDCLRDRAVELRAGRLLFHEESQLLSSDASSQSHQPPHSARSSCAKPLTSRGAAGVRAAGIRRPRVTRKPSCSRPAIAPRSTPSASRMPRSMRLARFFSRNHGIESTALAEHFYSHRGVDAARHLFRVAAGLDSLVVGEPQILGQVKTAYTTSSDLQFTGTVTHRLFHAAFAVGKRVRNETALGEGAVSVSYAAIELAKKIFGDLSGRSVVILGAGEMAELTGVHLRAHKVKQITIASRTLAPAEALARRSRDAPCRGARSLRRSLAPTSSSRRRVRPSLCSRARWWTK